MLTSKLKKFHQTNSQALPIQQFLQARRHQMSSRRCQDVLNNCQQLMNTKMIL
jgi:hypothetical protein